MSVIALMAETSPSRPTAGGWQTLLFGLVFSAIGIPLATNYRGFLDRWARGQPAVPASLKKLPPWKWGSPEPRTTMRIVATAFAVLGPLLVIVGLARIIAGNP
ncbi:hypothetical protein ACH34T_13665 [Actinomadura sp. 9N215]